MIQNNKLKIIFLKLKMKNKTQIINRTNNLK